MNEKLDVLAIGAHLNGRGDGHAWHIRNPAAGISGSQ